MSGVVWSALGIAALVMALHPFLFYPLTLLLFVRRLPVREKVVNTVRPSVAICMSAFNEEAVIVDKVESLLALATAYGPARIHIYVDGATDQTAKLLARYAEQIDLVLSTERKGKTAGLNELVARSTSDYLAFTDANVVVRSGTLWDLVEPLSDPIIGCASARLSYVNGRESETSTMGSAYWTVEEAIKRVESDRVGVIGIDGAFFAMPRADYHPAPPHLIDDFFVSMKVLVDGKRAVSVASVQVQERSATVAGEEMTRKARIACQAVKVHLALRPEFGRLPFLQRYAYVSHRLMKWALPFTLAAALVCFQIALLATVGPVALLIPLAAAALLALGVAARIWIFKLCWVAMLNLAGVARGVLEGLLTQQTYTTWTPAASIRAKDA